MSACERTLIYVYTYVITDLDNSLKWWMCHFLFHSWARFCPRCNPQRRVVKIKDAQEINLQWGLAQLLLKKATSVYTRCPNQVEKEKNEFREIPAEINSCEFRNAAILEFSTMINKPSKYLLLQHMERPWNFVNLFKLIGWNSLLVNALSSGW